MWGGVPGETGGRGVGAVSVRCRSGGGEAARSVLGSVLAPLARFGWGPGVDRPPSCGSFVRRFRKL